MGKKQKNEESEIKEYARRAIELADILMETTKVNGFEIHHLINACLNIIPRALKSLEKDPDEFEDVMKRHVEEIKKVWDLL